MIVKIMNSEGKFSTGGSRYNIRFTKKGKTWSSLGYVKSHLRQHSDTSLKDNYSNCTIVMVDDENDYQKTEIPFDEFLEDFMVENKEKQKKKKIDEIKSRRKFLVSQIEKFTKEIEDIDYMLAQGRV